jgi:hypothetical protein
MADEPSDDEFALWLTPKAALAAVPDDVDEAARRKWIVRRLLDGQIVARAETMKLTDINGPQEARRAIIERRFWDWRELGDWFSSGDLEVTDAPEVNSAGRRFSLRVPFSYDEGESRITRISVATFYGVRLDPANFPRPKGGAPTAAEFEEWIHPCDVIEWYNQQGDHDPKGRAVQMLRDGYLQAAAAQLIINGNDLGLALIPREMWEFMSRSDVWVTGRYRLSAKGRSLSAYDVRVDRNIRKLPRPEAPQQSEAVKAPDAKRLSEARLAAWAKLFFGAEPTATENEARASLTGMFPDNSVSRARLRAVMPARRRGRRLKTKEEN